MILDIRVRDVSRHHYNMSTRSSEIASRIETLRIRIKRIKAGCANLLLLAKMWNEPSVTGRSIQVGDVIEGPRGHPPGLVQEIFLEDDRSMAFIFSPTSFTYSCALEKLKHASSKTLDEVADEAAASHAESLKTLTEFETELSALISTH